MSEEEKEEKTLAEQDVEKQKEVDEHYRVNDVLIGCADGLKQIHDGLVSIETSENEYGIAKAIVLTLAYEFINSIEKRAAEFQQGEIDYRRQKDRELTEQDKEIMALVKELQDPNKN